MHDFQFVGYNIEDEFVMNLHYHAGAEFAPGHFTIDVNHGFFDDVGCRPLNRGIDGITFGISKVVLAVRERKTMKNTVYRKEK